ncbi:MAG: 4Fe-4S binding protein, partial [Firmicutes bacterium]|nr:4Fe-4S binding protein [Bacillota bacterium]
FASAVPSVINALFNQVDFTLVVLDNSTTAMTGHQPHPGTGRTMMGETVPPVSIEGVLKGVGLTCVETVDPLDHEKAVETVKRVAAEKGVKAIVFRSPCIAISKPSGKCAVDGDACIGCRTCIDEIGCPALSFEGGKAAIDPGQCTGCGLCSQICPAGAIVPAGKEARHE